MRADAQCSLPRVNIIFAVFKIFHEGGGGVARSGQSPTLQLWVEGCERGCSTFTSGIHSRPEVRVWGTYMRPARETSRHTLDRGRAICLGDITVLSIFHERGGGV